MPIRANKHTGWAVHTTNGGYNTAGSLLEMLTQTKPAEGAVIHLHAIDQLAMFTNSTPGAWKSAINDAGEHRLTNRIASAGWILTAVAPNPPPVDGLAFRVDATPLPEPTSVAIDGVGQALQEVFEQLDANGRAALLRALQAVGG